MTRNELLAAIEEATDADLSSLAARDPEEAAAELDYRAGESEHDAQSKHGNAEKSTARVRSEHRAFAETLRMLAAELRKSIEHHEAA